MDSRNSIDLSQLVKPEREYYANTAIVDVRGRLVSWGFAQLTVSRTNSVQSAKGFDMTTRALLATQKTFGQEFRDGLRTLMEGHEPMAPYPKDSSSALYSAAFPAQLFRVILNDLGCALDIYQVEPGATIAAVPIMRIRCFPPLIAFIVSEADRILNTGRR